MRKVIVILIGVVLFGCKSAQQVNSSDSKSEINLILNKFKLVYY